MIPRSRRRSSSTSGLAGSKKKRFSIGSKARTTPTSPGQYSIAASRHIGFIGLHAINWRHRAGTGGILIGERSAWGQGYATDAVRVRTRFAFAQLGLHRINGHTFNPAMKRVYEKAGYRHEGTARKMFWRDGQWYDVSLFAILEEDWFSNLPAN